MSGAKGQPRGSLTKRDLRSRNPDGSSCIWVASHQHSWRTGPSPWGQRVPQGDGEQASRDLFPGHRKGLGGTAANAGPLALPLKSFILISVSGKSRGSFSFPMVLHLVFQFILLQLFFVKKRGSAGSVSSFWPDCPDLQPEGKASHSSSILGMGGRQTIVRGPGMNA